MRMQTLPLVLLVLAIQAGHAAPRFRPFPHDPFTSARSGVSGNIVDKPVAAKLRELEIRPGGTCSDSVFVRRVYLDVIGSLPTADEAASFIRDRSPQKRRVMIDALLERDEFADYWALKWCDLLRVKSEFPINLWPNAVQAYHRWIRSCIKENVPYDRLVREVLISSGSNFRVPQVNFYRAVQGNEPETIARAVALTFMGTRAETWPEERLSSLAAFFSGITYKKTSEWKEEIVYVDLSTHRPKPSQPVPEQVFCPMGNALLWLRTKTRAASSPTGWSPPTTRGSRVTSSIASGTGCSAAGSSTPRMTSGRTTRRSTPSCSHCSRASWSTHSTI